MHASFPDSPSTRPLPSLELLERLAFNPDRAAVIDDVRWFQRRRSREFRTRDPLPGELRGARRRPSWRPHVAIMRAPSGHFLRVLWWSTRRERNDEAQARAAFAVLVDALARQESGERIRFVCTAHIDELADEMRAPAVSA